MLADADKRARYDRFGHAGVGGAPAAGGFDPTIFAGLRGHLRRPRRHLRLRRVFGGGRRRGGPQRGADLRYDLEITFEQAAKGAETTIQIPRQETLRDLPRLRRGAGNQRRRRARSAAAPGSCAISRASSPSRAPAASAAAPARSITKPCPTCRGQGTTEQQRKLTVKIPAGIATGQRLRLSGEGEAGAQGGPPATSTSSSTCEEHAFFQRDGNDLHCEVPLNFTTLALGGEITVPGIDGEEPSRCRKARSRARRSACGQGHAGRQRAAAAAICWSPCRASRRRS